MKHSFGIARRASLLTGALLFLMAPCVQAQQNPFQSLTDVINKAKQQLQQKTGTTPANGTPAAPANPAPSAPAPSAPPSSPTTAAPASAGDNVFVPPAEQASKPAGPLDPAKLMDIAGIHIGMPIAQTVPILEKIHPGTKVQPDTRSRDEPMAAYSVSLYVYHPPPSDNIWVNYTFDTLEVYSVSRSVGYLPQIAKSVLLEALRKKYGPETAALSFSAPPKTDNDITKMWWLSDEQGNIIHPANMSKYTYTPYGCAPKGFGYDVVTSYRTAFRDVQNGKLPAETFCDSTIIFYVEIENGSDSSLVGNTRSFLFDSALFRRSTIAWAHHLDTQAQEQQQKALQNANQAKPNL